MILVLWDNEVSAVLLSSILAINTFPTTSIIKLKQFRLCRSAYHWFPTVAFYWWKLEIRASQCMRHIIKLLRYAGCMMMSEAAPIEAGNNYKCAAATYGWGSKRDENVVSIIFRSWIYPNQMTGTKGLRSSHHQIQKNTGMHFCLRFRWVVVIYCVDSLEV